MKKKHPLTQKQLNMNKTTFVAAQRLQKSGLRPSPQRIAVYSYLCRHNTHPTAETVYKALAPEYPTLSLTTVYQSLEALHERGLALKITIEDGKMRFDADTSSHGHFKCTKCGEIFDFSYPDATFFPAPPKGFSAQEAHLYYRGECPKCKA